MADLATLSEHARGLHGVPAQCVPCHLKTLRHAAPAASLGLPPTLSSPRPSTAREHAPLAACEPHTRDCIHRLLTRLTATDSPFLAPRTGSFAPRRCLACAVFCPTPQLHLVLARRPHLLGPHRQHAGPLMVRLWDTSCVLKRVGCRNMHSAGLEWRTRAAALCGTLALLSPLSSHLHLHTRLWTNVFIIMLLVLVLSEDKPVQAEVLMYLYVFSILNDFINLVIWGPWDRETSTMRFSLTMASVNLIIKPFLTPAVLELVKRNGSSAGSVGMGGAMGGGMGMGGPMGGRGGYNPIGGMGGPPGGAPAGGYPGPPGPYSAGPYGMAHGGDDMNAI